MEHQIKPLKLDDYFDNHYYQNNNLNELDIELIEINDILLKQGVIVRIYGSQNDVYDGVATAYKDAGWNVIQSLKDDEVTLVISCRWFGARLDELE